MELIEAEINNVEKGKAQIDIKVNSLQDQFIYNGTVQSFLRWC